MKNQMSGTEGRIWFAVMSLISLAAAWSTGGSALFVIALALVVAAVIAIAYELTTGFVEWAWDNTFAVLVFLDCLLNISFAASKYLH